MRGPRSLGIGLAVALALAACGGSGPGQGPGSATQGPGADPGGGGGATAGPQATTDPGGGGGSGGGGTGKVTYQVTGSVERSGELPFFAAGSRFGGPAGVALTFTRGDGVAIFSIGQIEGAETVAVVDEEYGLNWAECEVFELNVDGNNATGRFECSNGFGTKVSDQSLLTNFKMTGTFDAHG